MKNQMTDYIQTNAHYWQSAYNAPYPESFIFRLDGRVLKKYKLYDQEKKDNFKILDFGCGQGSHIKYFKDSGFDSYGVDISEHSIEIAKKKFGNESNKIKLISPEAKEDDDYFNVKFDLIISSQVLYYISASQLEKRIKSFKNMLKPGGHIFVTMMTTKSWYYTWIIDKNLKTEDGMHVVEHTDNIYNERVKKNINKHFINFTQDKKDLISKFHLFKPIEIGEYDLTYNENESEHHYMFFGKLK